METINLVSRPNNLSGDTQDVINRKVKANLEELDLRLNEVGPSILKTVSLTLAVKEDGHVISGNSFDPILTSVPNFIIAMQTMPGNEYVNVSGIIDKIVKNGDVYDVVTTPIEEEMTNVKITVL